MRYANLLNWIDVINNIGILFERNVRSKKNKARRLMELWATQLIFKSQFENSIFPCTKTHTILDEWNI